MAARLPEAAAVAPGVYMGWGEGASVPFTDSPTTCGRRAGGAIGGRLQAWAGSDDIWILDGGVRNCETMYTKQAWVLYLCLFCSVLCS